MIDQFTALEGVLTSRSCVAWLTECARPLCFLPSSYLLNCLHVLELLELEPFVGGGRCAREEGVRQQQHAQGDAEAPAQQVEEEQGRVGDDPHRLGEGQRQGER